MKKSLRSDRARAVSGSLVVVLLAAGLTMALLAPSDSTFADLGLAVFGGAVVGGVFVVVEYQLNMANQRQHDHEALLLQLTSTNDLEGIDLSERDLSGAYLPAKKLVAAQLDRTRLAGAKMYFADLRHASMRSIRASGCDFGGANLEEADIEGGILVSADFYDANIRNTVLRGADLSHARIVNADLSGADCRGANFTGAKIKDSKLFGTDLRDAIMSNVVIEKTQYDAETRWPDGFSPPPSTQGGSVWIEGTTLTEWLTRRRAEQVGPTTHGHTDRPR